MGMLRHDVRYAVRMLGKSPLFTVVAVLTLALGIGLNAAVFSAVDALLLRPLPGVREPERLVQLFRAWPGEEAYGASSIPHYLDIRERGSSVFSGVLLWNFVPVNLSTGDRNERVIGQLVSANFFSVLGVSAERGRTFLPEEDVGVGSHPVIVVSHASWQGRFGGDPGIVGRTVTMNGRQWTVVGVAPAGFDGPVPAVAPELWAPMMMQHELVPGPDRIAARGENSMNVLARLRPGVTVTQAREAMTAILAQLTEQYPGDYKGTGITVVPQSEAGIHPSFRSVQLGLSAVMMAVVAMLLLIACVNVANLFLARARDRRREMAVRLSLGARRAQLVRQLLVESLLFSLVAGAAGLVLAFAVVRLANGIQLPIDVPMHFGLRLSTPVLLFTLGASLATGVLFGLAPAVQASRPDLVPSLKGEASAESAGKSRVSNALVVAQIALSLLLLVCSGLFLRSLRTATALDKGFASDNLLLASMDPGLQGYDNARARAFYRTLLERVRALPGVRAAALSDQLPLGLGNQQRGVGIPGHQPAPDEKMSFDFALVTPGYFAAMGIPLLSGRDFTDRDDSSAAGAIVVNERLAQRFWPGQSALGKRIETGGRMREVIAVVRTGKYRTLGEQPLEFMYLPHAQDFKQEMTLTVRTAGDPSALAPRVREVIAELDRTLPVYDVRTMNDHLGIALLPARLGGSFLGAFGVLGLLLAAVGIYGVMAYSVAQRRREIGIRVALGAARAQVMGLVLRQGLTLAAIGTAAGLAGALGAARLVRGLLYGASATDPLTFVGVPSLLLLVASVAVYVPARRAAGVDPMTALREQ